MPRVKRKHKHHVPEGSTDFHGFQTLAGDAANGNGLISPVLVVDIYRLKLLPESLNLETQVQISSHLLCCSPHRLKPFFTRHKTRSVYKQLTITILQCEPSPRTPSAVTFLKTNAETTSFNSREMSLNENSRTLKKHENQSTHIRERQRTRRTLQIRNEV